VFGQIKPIFIDLITLLRTWLNVERNCPAPSGANTLEPGMPDLTFSECGSFTHTPFFLDDAMPRVVRPYVNKFLSNVLAEPARSYF
jgi:hypothetical protein